MLFRICASYTELMEKFKCKACCQVDIISIVVIIIIVVTNGSVSCVCCSLENKQAVGGRPPRYASTPCKLTITSYLFSRWHLFQHTSYLRHQQQVDLLTLKVVPESRVTSATSVPILVFLGLSVLELCPMYTTDVRQKHNNVNQTQLLGTES